MDGASLRHIQIDQSTKLGILSNHASVLSSVDFSTVEVSENFLKSAFGDGSVFLPEGYTVSEGVLAHWHPDVLDWPDFNFAWRAWQTKIGYRAPD